MSRFIDLSHSFEDGMPGFVMRAADGTTAHFTASVKPFLTHQESRHFYDGKASFELTEITFQTSIGTYLDAPSHRFEGMRDISELEIDELILPGVVVDARAAAAGSAVGLGDIELPSEIRGRAVLFRFGWDRFWGAPEYDAYPFIDREVIQALVVGGAKLVGVDSFNIDSREDPERPAHSELLQRDILVVENLRNLEALPSSGFRFFAVPIKAKATAAMTVRAFAELQGGEE